MNPPVLYRIWREDGAGFNSILSSVLGHLHIAEKHGWTPVIDLETHATVYSEDVPVNGSRNVWEYYYAPVSSASVADLQEAYRVLDTGGRYPHEVMNPLFSQTPWLLDVYDRNVHLKPEIVIELERARLEVEISRRALGVHFRGKEMRNALHHPAPPTLGQAFARVDKLLDGDSYDFVYLVTEGWEYLDAFVNRYGSRIRSLNVARSGNTNVYHEYPRDLHRFKLGLEVLIETQLLAECGGLVCGYSGVSEMSIVLSRGHYKDVQKIWNGRIRGGRLGAKYLWPYRNRTPRFLGGFRK